MFATNLIAFFAQIKVLELDHFTRVELVELRVNCEANYDFDNKDGNCVH